MLSLGRKINDRTTITVPPSATPAPREVRIMRDEAVEQKS
jgi:hypothetical protein